jgi:hypothetical protein
VGPPAVAPPRHGPAALRQPTVAGRSRRRRSCRAATVTGSDNRSWHSGGGQLCHRTVVTPAQTAGRGVHDGRPGGGAQARTDTAGAVRTPNSGGLTRDSAGPAIPETPIQPCPAARKNNQKNRPPGIHRQLQAITLRRRRVLFPRTRRYGDHRTPALVSGPDLLGDGGPARLSSPAATRRRAMAGALRDEPPRAPGPAPLCRRRTDEWNRVAHSPVRSNGGHGGGCAPPECPVARQVDGQEDGSANAQTLPVKEPCATNTG